MDLANLTNELPWGITAAAFSNPMYLVAPPGTDGNSDSTGFDISAAAAVLISFEGTYSGQVLVHQQTLDPTGRDGWFSVEGAPSNGGTASSTGSTADTCYVFPCLGVMHRVKVTALSSGTLEARIRIDQAPLSSTSAGGGGGGGGGDVNLNEIDGNSVDVGLGNAGLGTLRVVLSDDSPGLTGDLNLVEVNGIAVATGTGAANAGTMRVAVSTDSGISAGALVNTAAPTYVNGATQPLSLTTKAGLRVQTLLPDGTDFDLSEPASVLGQNGTTIMSAANPFAVSGTVNIGTIAGIATEVSLAKLTLAQGSTTSGQTGPLNLAAVTTAAPSYTTGQSAPLSMDTTGALRVTGSFTSGNVAQGSTTSGQTGLLIQGAVTTAAPSYTTAQTNPLSLTTGGALRVEASQATAANLNALVSGPDANNATPTVNPLAVAGLYSTNPTTLTNGAIGRLQLDSRGNLKVNIFGNNSVNAVVAGTSADNTALGVALNVNSVGMIYDGSTSDMARAISASFGSSVGVAAVEEAGAPFVRIATNTTTNGIKSGAGILHKVVINTKGAAANTLTLYDNTTATGTVIAIIDTVNINSQALLYDLAFATGLSAITATGTAADITIVYR